MEKNKPKVSVIIPTYNRSHLVGRAIQSVLNQTFTDFELIIVDDASTDNTKEVVESFNAPRIRYIRHEQNKGGGATRNTGIEAAYGEYIAFLDSDDEWLPRKLEKQLLIFRGYGKANSKKVVYTGILWIDQESGKIIQKGIPIKEGWLFYDLFLDNCIIGGGSTVIVPKECIDKVGFFDERLDSCQDLDMWIRLSECFQFCAIKEPLAKIYIHKERITEDLRAKTQARQRILGKFSKKIRMEKEIYAYYHFKTGNIFCHAGDIKEGRSELIKAIKIEPLNFKYHLYLISTCFGYGLFQCIAWLKRKISIHGKN